LHEDSLPLQRVGGCSGAAAWPPGCGVSRGLCKNIWVFEPWGGEQRLRGPHATSAALHSPLANERGNHREIKNKSALRDRFFQLQRRAVGGKSSGGWEAAWGGHKPCAHPSLVQGSGARSCPQRLQDHPVAVYHGRGANGVGACPFGASHPSATAATGAQPHLPLSRAARPPPPALIKVQERDGGGKTSDPPTTPGSAASR